MLKQIFAQSLNVIVNFINFNIQFDLATRKVQIVVSGLNNFHIIGRDKLNKANIFHFRIRDSYGQVNIGLSQRKTHVLIQLLIVV